MNHKKIQNNHFTIMIIVLALVFLVFSGGVLLAGSRYVSNNLLQANEATAVDIAMLVKNNFSITDEEVSYMKGLSFNEMEVDPINFRLMDIGNGIKLNAAVENVYIVMPLSESEQRKCETEYEAELIGYEVGTNLDGMWLLNGLIDENGKFIVTERDNICRYTALTELELEGIHDKKSFGEYSNDIWGKFITGYVPVYTVEGNFVGLLGIDITLDGYQNSAQRMIWFLIGIFFFVTVFFCIMFIVFYLKYIRAKREAIYFDFYSRMSHDMRTPMSGILGMAAISKDESDVTVLHQNFNSVESAGKYMLNLINDTLDIQAIKTGKMTLSPGFYSLAKTINDLSALISPIALKKEVKFKICNTDIQKDCLCYVDEIRLKQIFINLLSNSIKFTPKGGYVTLGMECLGVDGDIKHFKFNVTDNGVGMSEKYMKNHLFKPFEQESNSLTTQYDGSGLGLFITKQLVEMMGGHIEVDSKTGVGTTFLVYLDIKTKDIDSAMVISPQNDDPLSPDVKLEGKHILLCEDHPLNMKIAKTMLEKKGCIVDVAENGKIGLEAFQKSDAFYYHAILMDIRMPVMDGLEVTRQIRALNKADAKTVPIIAMSANAYEEDIKTSINVGMNAHLAKPVDPKSLFDTLTMYINKEE